MLQSFTSKLGQKSHRTDKAKLKDAFVTAIDGLHEILQLMKQLPTSVGPPGLHAGITGLLYVLDAIQQTAQNASNIEQLAIRIRKLSTILEKSQHEKTLSPSIVARMDRLSEEWNNDIEELKKLASRNLARRLIQRNGNAKAISDRIQSVTWSIENLTVESMLAIEFTLDELGRLFQEGFKSLEQKVDIVSEEVARVSQQLNTIPDLQDGCLPHAILAPFNHVARDLCLHGTRTDVLAQIFAWLSPDSPVCNDTVDSRIFWINGTAGTGKTTIAHTVSTTCKERGILGASFFCSRDNADCSNPKLIFTTIAYQLGQLFPLFKDEVAAVLRSNREIGFSDLSYQLKELIVAPLRTIGDSITPCVVVIDALDECKDDSTISVILTSLSMHVAELSPLKFLITSRPERHITSGFTLESLDPATRRLILHEVELDVVQTDIERYVTARLKEISGFYSLPASWPSTSDIQALTTKSCGLFIFAATSIRFIRDRNYSDPQNQLTKLLQSTMPILESASPYTCLDSLYAQVLTNAFPNISPGLAGRLKIILGSVIFLQNALSPCDLERLLNVNKDHNSLSPSSVRGTLVHLHSVVIVPEDDEHVIRVLHPSFFDFFTNRDRCRNPRLVVDAGAQHALLAHACLRAINFELKRNPCRIESPTIHNSEVADLPMRIMEHIPGHVQYACRHWASHLKNAMLSGSLLEQLKELCTVNLLHLVEACSLLGNLRNLLISLDVAQRILTTNIRKDIRYIKTLLNDCEHFVREFFAVLSSSSQQVYHSALMFTPIETLFWEKYGNIEPPRIRMQNGCQKKWNLFVRTMEGHSSTVSSVAFSPDGTRIVSGSGDKTLRLWDAVSGAHLNTLKGHSDSVRSVTFSPDGTRIVSGSNDKTLRLWDAVSGAHLNTLKGHSSWVRSVTFSPDGTRIVSGSDDNTLRLWDAVSGAHLNILKGHSTWVQSVAFSSDGTRIVSGSFDKTLRMWDAVSGAHVNTLKGHSSWVQSVAFSPDGTRIVSGSTDKTLRLWDAVSGAHLNTLKGHSDRVQSVTFSPDSTHIVSGSDDKTLRLWDAVSGAHLNTLKGHSSWARSVAFSPDGTRIVSGSDDKTLRLWGVSGAHLNTLKGHSDRVLSVTFSPNGSHIVSGSTDKTLRLWDAVSGAHLNTLKGHSGWVQSVAFSPGGTRIVSGSGDKTLRLWDAVSGAHLNTLKGHFDWVRSVAFSPDGTRIVSGSDDKTLRLWGVSGAHLNTLKGHSDRVLSVTFSPDGTRIVSGSTDKTLQLWDAVSGAHLNTLKGHSGSVQSVAFSPDGTRIVSGSSDNKLRLWDAVSGAHVETLHSSGMAFAAFDSIGMISDKQNALHYFMESNGWIYLVSTSHQRLCWIPVECRGVVLTSNGKRVALGTEDGRVVILDFSSVI